MPKENIFNLAQLTPISNDVESPTGNQIDDKLLQGYTEVDKSMWDKLPYKTHIRYLRTDGTMRKGGYIKGVTQTTDKSNKDTFKFDLVSNFLPGAISWQLYAGSVEKIWKKDSNDIMPQQDIPDLSDIKDDMSFCKQQIALLAKEIQKNSADILRLTQFLKKMASK